MAASPSAFRPAARGVVVVVWLVALVVGVVVALVAPAEARALWLAISLAGCLVLSFALQVWGGRSAGFLVRVSASMLGALAVLGVIAMVAGIGDLVSGLG